MEVVIDGIRYVPVRVLNITKKPFHDLIKEARKSRRESLEVAAQNIGIAKSRLWELEQGETHPVLPTLIRILEHYNLEFNKIEYVVIDNL